MENYKFVANKKPLTSSSATHKAMLQTRTSKGYGDNSGGGPDNTSGAYEDMQKARDNAIFDALHGDLFAYKNDKERIANDEDIIFQARIRQDLISATGSVLGFLNFLVGDNYSINGVTTMISTEGHKGFAGTSISYSKGSESYEYLVEGGNFFVDNGSGTIGSGEQGGWVETSFEINEAADKAGTLTSVNIYGAQKLAGVAANDMAKLTAMTVVGRITGITSAVDNGAKFWENPRANWWNGVESVGQLTAITVGWLTGVEEVELIYNATTLTIDLTGMVIKQYKNDHQ